MITLQEPAAWSDGRVDGVVRDIRRPIPYDGLLSGAVFRMGDETAGPVVSMTIQERIFPRKAPVHMHKSDSFRMALGEPIRVGGTSYAHGEFRLQRSDTFYGPEYWTDEVGTNQLLLMADRRGLKPYLTDAQRQRSVDLALADDVSLENIVPHPRDAVVEHKISNGFGATVRAGHFDAGFADSGTWPALSEGSRLAVIALGHPWSGPLVLCWDRPPGAPALPACRLPTDVARLVVDGSLWLGDEEFGRLGFRLQQADSRQDSCRPGDSGCRELWIVADRRGWSPTFDDGTGSAGRSVLTEAGRLIDAVIAEAAA
ncbi:MAG TPA: hypothetical protein VHC18_27685 [Amycolatopsis sp.]|nr:hypothetical protein [Amycolatopsis sp.]